ncbi:hypothetical protein D9601_17675 [Sphingomonas sp. MA1305]|nr:hypothetical protein [Sphingomonas sp. MA1305]
MRANHSGHRRWRPVAAIFAITVGLFGIVQVLALPFVGLTEGFQTMMMSMSWDMAMQNRVTADLAYPFNAEFYYVSRYGMVTLLALLQPWLAAYPALGISMVMLTSLVLYVVATLVFAGHVFGTQRRWRTAAVVLAPVVAASAYSLNDSLPSGALVAAALALWTTPRRRTAMDLAGGAVTGLLLGLAISLRFDAAFILPGMAALAWWRDGVRPAVIRIALMGLVALLAASVVYGTGGLTILDPPLIGRVAIGLWSEPISLAHPLKVAAVSLSLPAWIALVIGLWIIARHDRRLAATVAIAIAGYLLPYATSLYQPRYLLPALPFLIGPIAVGLAGAFTSDTATGNMSRILCTSTLAFFLPVVGGQSEGPRAVIGNVWNAIDWTIWLARLRHDNAAAAQAIAAAGNDGQPIVSTGWSEERLVHLALVDAGFRPLPLDGTGRCRLAKQRYRRGGQVVDHIRLDVPFTGASTQRVHAVLVAPCWQTWGILSARTPSVVTFVTASLDRPTGVLGWLTQGSGVNWRPLVVTLPTDEIAARVATMPLPPPHRDRLDAVTARPPLLAPRPLLLGAPRFLPGF